MPNPMIGLIGASIGSTAIQAKSASKATKAATTASDKELALQKEIYDKTYADLAPYKEAGGDAMAAYLYEMGLGPKPTFGAEPLAIEKFMQPGTSSAGGMEKRTFDPAPWNPLGKTGKGQPGKGPASGTYASTGTLAALGGIPSKGGAGWQPAGGNAVTQTTNAAGTPMWRVGGQEFASKAEAQAYAAEHGTQGTEYGGYAVSPMAQYLMEEGVDTIEGSRAAAGGLYSGATLKALEDNRRQTIEMDTDKYFNRLTGLMGTGQSAASGQASAGQYYAGQSGNAMQSAASAQAAGAYNKGNALAGGIGDIAGIYGYFNKNPMSAFAQPANNPNWLSGGAGAGVW